MIKAWWQSLSAWFAHIQQGAVIRYRLRGYATGMTFEPSSRGGMNRPPSLDTLPVVPKPDRETLYRDTLVAMNDGKLPANLHIDPL